MENVVLITGASRGIGAATAKLVAEKGYFAVVNYVRDRDSANAVVAEIEAKGGKAIAIQADVAAPDQVIALFGRIDRLGMLTGLVNNVGVLETQCRVENLDPARVMRILRTNVLSCVMCTQAAIKRMSTHNGGKGGSIVNVSSIASKTGSPGEYVDYAASKGAMDTFTIGVAKEVAAQGIRVNGVRPAFIYTDIHASGGEPGRVDRVKHNVPLRRGGHPEEVARAILWLLSDDSSYSTGIFIDISGGV